MVDWVAGTWWFFPLCNITFPKEVSLDSSGGNWENSFLLISRQIGTAILVGTCCLFLGRFGCHFVGVGYQFSGRPWQPFCEQ